MVEQLATGDVNCVPSTRNEDIKDLLDGDEACKVLHFVRLHERLDEDVIVVWIEREGQPTESIIDVAVYVRVKGVSVDLVACCGVIFCIGDEGILQADKDAIDPGLSGSIKLIIIREEFVAVLVAVPYWIAGRTTMELRLEAVRVERAIFMQLCASVWTWTLGISIYEFLLEMQ